METADVSKFFLATFERISDGLYMCYPYMYQDLTKFIAARRFTNFTSVL